MLSRPFIALYVAVFVAVMGISMVSPLLPVYAEELGANGIWLGITFAAFALSQTICAPIVGKLSDRYPRKPFIVAGLLVYMIAALGYLTATSFYQVIAFRAFSGVGTSLIFSVARAYIGDLTPPHQEGKWAGAFATADVLGFGVGPVVAGMMRSAIGFDSVFVAMAGMLALSAVLAIVSLPNRPPRHAGLTEAAPSISLGAALHDRMVLALTLHSVLMALAIGSLMSFLAVRLEVDLRASPALIGLAFSAQDLTGGITQPFFGRLADRSDRRRLVVIGLAGLGIGLFVLGLAEHAWLVIVLLVVMGASSGLTRVASSALLVVAGRRAGMGTVLGLWSTGNGAGIFLGALASGGLVTLAGTEAAFFFGGAMIVVGATLFLGLTRGMLMSDAPDPPPRTVPVAAD